MSAELNKLVLVIANEVNGVVANDFGVMKITSDTASKTTAIPYSWRGQEVSMRAFTNAVVIGCSKSSSAQVDRTVAGSSAGATVKVGMTLPAGELCVRRLPDWASHETMYFVHQSTSDGTILEITLNGL